MEGKMSRQQFYQYSRCGEGDQRETGQKPLKIARFWP